MKDIAIIIMGLRILIKYEIEDGDPNLIAWKIAIPTVKFDEYKLLEHLLREHWQAHISSEILQADYWLQQSETVAKAYAQDEKDAPF